MDTAIDVSGPEEEALPAAATAGWQMVVRGRGRAAQRQTAAAAGGRKSRATPGMSRPMAFIMEAIRCGRGRSTASSAASWACGRGRAARAARGWWRAEGWQRCGRAVGSGSGTLVGGVLLCVDAFRRSHKGMWGGSIASRLLWGGEVPAAAQPSTAQYAPPIGCIHAN